MLVFFFFKQKTAYELRISDWSSDVCSSDLLDRRGRGGAGQSAQCRGVARADAGGARQAAEGGRHFAGGGAGADGRIEAGRSCPRDPEPVPWLPPPLWQGVTCTRQSPLATPQSRATEQHDEASHSYITDIPRRRVWK